MILTILKDNNMKRISNIETANYIGQEITVCGWVDAVRPHGKVIFINLRDRSGIIQVVFTPDKASFGKVQELRPEWVVAITGIVKKRPEGMINDKILTGTVEIDGNSIEIYSEAQTLPFSINDDGYEINEEKRLTYRYLDLRRERLKNNLIIRQKVLWMIRNYLINLGFIEIETPIITKSTPEGARDYVVPSRLINGSFFALPQSPQQYKQLLMIAGIEKYFQVARCFRDEDPRSDRQPEFTQLDLEMSFVEREDIMAIIETLYIELVKTIFPDKQIQTIPFPRLKYQDVIKEYGTDRPDIREDKSNPNLMAFCWVIDFPFFEKDKEGGWTFTHNPFSAPKSEHMEWLMNKKNIGDILTTQYDIVCNGFEVGGGSIRNHHSDALKKVFEIIGLSEERINNGFKHMLEAFSYGAPPHGGIALGIERFLAIARNEPSIREVIAFPKTGDARDPMMQSPSQITPTQLEELGLIINDKKKD